MEDKTGFEQIRSDVEARQKNILWEDARHGGKSVDAFLWKGDPNARPVQRAGLVVFGLTFLLLSICMFSIPFERPQKDGVFIDIFFGLGSALISIRLFRNAFLRIREPRENRKD
jgi:hypothetical protein